MKQFFKFLFASLFGTLLAIFLFFAILFGIIGIIASSSGSDEEPEVAENSVLFMDFEEEVVDRSGNNPFENFDFSSFESNPKIGLNDIINSLDKASKDDRIKGLFLNVGFVQMGMAQLDEVRNSIKQLRDSGKFVIAYGEFFEQNAYYLATAADKIYLHPGGLLEYAGLSSNQIFLKGTLEKLEIDMQVIRHGKFKSAIEPFTRSNMSEENRLQTRTFLNSLWGHMVGQISEARHIEVSRLNELASDLLIDTPEKAQEFGLIDGVVYQDEVIAELKTLAGIDADDDLELVKLHTYKHAKLDGEPKKTSEDYKNKVAIVYASGEITSGKSEDGMMGSETIAKAIEDAREDENVKAVVLRVNSPGGSSLASDVIWRQVVLTKEVKPVVVSMGDLAASGGYYISCAADRILADENTITGSIGVFGIVPNAQGLFNKKLGITFDTVNTNKNADLFSLVRPIKPIEVRYITTMIERIYDDFVKKVAEGRNLTYAQVDSIGQGRVWSGKDAMSIGLVDELGGLDRAIEVAAELGEVKKYRILELPKQKDPFQEMFNVFTENVESKMAQSYFGSYYSDLNHVYQTANRKGIYMRLPFDFLVE